MCVCVRRGHLAYGAAAFAGGEPPCNTIVMNVMMLGKATCPMLHVDHVKYRSLVCTLMGTGTMWIADPSAPLAMECSAASVDSRWVQAPHGDPDTSVSERTPTSRSHIHTCLLTR